MSLEENKAIVRRHMIDVLEQGHVELIDGYYAPDGSVPGMDTPQQWRDRVLWHHKYASGFKITILNMVAEDNLVAVHWQADLTFSVMPDPPPSMPHYPLGKPISWKIMNIFGVVNGKIVSMVSANPWIEVL